MKKVLVGLVVAGLSVSSLFGFEKTLPDFNGATELEMQLVKNQFDVVRDMGYKVRKDYRLDINRDIAEKMKYQIIGFETKYYGDNAYGHPFFTGTYFVRYPNGNIVKKLADDDFEFGQYMKRVDKLMTLHNIKKLNSVQIAGGDYLTAAKAHTVCINQDICDRIPFWKK